MWVAFLTTQNHIRSCNTVLQPLLRVCNSSHRCPPRPSCVFSAWERAKCCSQGKATGASRLATHLWASAGGSGHVAQEVEEEYLVTSLETGQQQGEWSNSQWALLQRSQVFNVEHEKLSKRGPIEIADTYTVCHSRRLKGAVQFFNLVGQRLLVSLQSIYVYYYLCYWCIWLTI